MQVKQGILDAAAELFHVSFQQEMNVPSWEPTVETWIVMDGGKPIGRFYLDMHPRPGKFSHAEMVPVLDGIRGKQLPEAILVCNFPVPTATDAGLMDYGDVETFFHEFGHLMHAILGGQTRWAGVSGFATEGDFIEVPSQMLEEFFRDEMLLQTFAKHYETGEVLPAEIIRKMKTAGSFGRADWVRTQLYYTTLSLDLHDQDPAAIDFDEITKRLYNSLVPWTWQEGNRMYASFGHLTGYSSNYYTYAFDKVIALDFFGQFDPADLLGCNAGARYRKLVLEQGGSKPGREMVRDFLGRDEEFAAFSKWLNEEFDNQLISATA